MAHTGVAAQEITVGLLKHKVAVIPDDGLGNVKCADYIRLNYSSPDMSCVETFRSALQLAIAEAQEGRYAQAVVDFFERSDTERGRGIVERIQTRAESGPKAAQ